MGKFRIWSFSRGRKMPFKSQAQRAKFAELLKQGKISQDTFNEWQKATGSKKLPKRIGSKKVNRVRTTKVIK